MIRCEKFRLDHLKGFKLRPEQASDFAPGQSPEIKTRAMTLLEDGQVVAIVGGAYVSLGVFQLWSYITPQVHPIRFHKKILALLEWFTRAEAPRRYQFDVRVSYQGGQDWAESLGFKREGVMRAYAPDGEDCYLYAKVGA